MNYSTTWNLDSIFPGGSHSAELHEFINELKNDIIQLQELIEDPSQLAESIEKIQQVERALQHGCLNNSLHINTHIGLIGTFACFIFIFVRF